MIEFPRWIDAGWLIVFGLIGIVTSLVVLFEGVEPIVVPMSMAGFVLGNRVVAKMETGRWDGTEDDLDRWRSA